MKRTVISAASALVLALALGACVSEPDPTLEQNPEYARGYADGCQTANSRVQGFKKTVARDDKAWKDVEPYRVGWRTGYNACGGDSQIGGESDFLQTDRFDTGPI